MIDKSHPLPLYYQIKQTIKDRLERQVYTPGSAIPTETELKKQFNVSRITIRRALDELVTEGLLIRQQGKGTFVQQPKITQDLNYISCWTEAMLAQGRHPSTARIKIYHKVPDPKIASLLEIGPEQEVICIERLRCGDNEPVSVMTNYVLPYLVPNIEKDGLDHESLYHVMESRYHLKFGKVKELVEAKGANPAEAKALKIEPGTPVLCVRRVSLDPNDVPFEVAVATSRADMYQYSVTLVGRPK